MLTARNASVLFAVSVLGLALSVGAAESGPPLEPLDVVGQVIDQNGAPVHGALVQLLNRDGVILRECLTGESGAFRFGPVAPTDLYAQARTGTRVSAPAPVRSGEPVTLALGMASPPPIVSEPADTPPVSRETHISEIRRQMTALGVQLAALERRLESLALSAPKRANPLRDSEAAAALAEEQDPDSGLYGQTGTGAEAVMLGDKVQIGGYGSFRYEANTLAPAAQIGTLPRAQTSYNSFDFRRFVLTLDASPVERLRFYTEIEFERLGSIEVERTAIPENRGSVDRAGVRFIQELEGQDGSELAMEQAWVQFDFNSYLSARMGVVLPPLGRFNTRHDDDAWDIPRRSLVDRGGPVLPVKAAWSELGAGLLGKAPVGQGFVDYQFFVLNGATLDFSMEEVVSLREGRNLLELEPEISFSSGPFNGTNTADAYSWRVGYTPRLGHEIALSGYHGEYTPSYLAVDSWIHAGGVDGRTTFGNFEIEGEFIYTDFGRLELVLNDLARQAVDAAAQTTSLETADLETEVEAGFAGPLTNQRYGYWVDFKYRFWPRALNNSFLGRGFENPELIPIVRFERIWFNDFVRSFDFAGGVITDLTTETLSQQRVSFGLAYRPATSIGFTLTWEHNRRMQGSTLIFPSTAGLGRAQDKTYNALIIGTVFGF